MLTVLKILVLISFIGGCVSPQPLESEVVSQSSSDSELEMANTTAEGVASSEEDESADETNLAEGYCIDDVYTKYLISRYKNEFPLQKKLKKYRSRISRNRVRRQYEYDAMHFANLRLNGKSAPYFGGIPVVTNEKVEFWVSYFKKRGRRDFARWLSRGESIKEHVLPVLRDHGMPQEFFYLAMVESGFNHGAYSKASATGTWQFISGTAKNYGLKINHWVDERRDPIKSTMAAASFLKDLYAEFGDWYLAMAAYNAGPGKIRRAIRRTGTRDFWEISKTSYLPRETKNYVPKVLAALLLSSDAKQHGFDIKPSADHRIPIQTVEVGRPVKLEEVAKELGISYRRLSSWNPEIRRKITPPEKYGPYPLRLSRELAERFPQIEPRLSKLEVTDIHMHKIRPGETLSHIARKYKVRIHQIKSLNPQLRAKALRIGKRIAVPIPGVVTKG